MMKKLLISSVLLGALGISGSAMACSLAAWNGGTIGTPEAGGAELPSAPNADPNLARYAGECAMGADNGDSVQDNSPTAEARMISSFYFLNDGSSSGDLMVAYADETGASPIYSVASDGSNVTVTPTAGTAASGAITAGWNAVQVEYNASGAVNLWLNVDAAPGNVSSAGTDTSGSTVESVRLGLQNGSGSVVLDAYEARRSTNVALLLPGDAFPDSAVDVLDLQAYVDEILGRSLISGAGVAQCAQDDVVDVLDIQCVVDTILGR